MTGAARCLAPLALLLLLAACASAPQASPQQRWLRAVDDATTVYNATRDAVAAAKGAGLIPPDRVAEVDRMGRVAESSLRTFAGAVQVWILVGTGDETDVELARAQAAAAIARLVAAWGGAR